MHYTVESHSPHLNQQVIGVGIKNNHMALLLLTTKTKYFKPQNRKLKYDYFFVTGNSSYMALNNLYCQHMIPEPKGLNPHELAQMWVNVLETRQNMSLKVGRKHHDMRIFCRIVGVRST